MNFTESLAPVAAWAGTWHGSNRLHDPHTNQPEDSPSTLIISPTPGGQFVRLDYTWGYQGAPQEGSLLLGTDSQTRALTGHWLDTWHMNAHAMVCRGTITDPNHLNLQGSYACPPGPDWGWRIELTLANESALRVRMFNVSPEGQAQPAVEAAYTRGPAAFSPAGQTVEHGLSEIGQIAVTVADVAKALPFYRDVLGLKFLFSPGPNLAFLA